MKSEFYSEIIPNYFLGSWHSTLPRTLENLKIKEVFHFGFEVDDKLEDVEYHYFDLEDNSQSLSYFKENLDQIHDQIEKRLQQGPVLVASSAGKSRSVTVTISFLIKKLNYTFEEAFALVKMQRPIINPNPTFLRFLKSL